MSYARVSLDPEQLRSHYYDGLATIDWPTLSEAYRLIAECETYGETICGVERAALTRGLRKMHRQSWDGMYLTALEDDALHYLLKRVATAESEWGIGYRPIRFDDEDYDYA